VAKIVISVDESVYARLLKIALATNSPINRVAQAIFESGFSRVAPPRKHKNKYRKFSKLTRKPNADEHEK